MRDAGTAARSPIGAPPRSASPWQRLYAGAHLLRWAWYRNRARRLPRPVISIGNLHWGGGGKTPLVSAVAGHLRARGMAVCILSRGYGATGGGGGKGGRSGEVRVVSRGDGPVLGPAEAGDEPVLLAGEQPGVAVVVGADRYRAGLEALARLRPAPDVFLLDDGFSHLALHRDLDVLAFPAADPFGGGRLWPGGRLREPLAAATRADAALLTGVTAAGARLQAATPGGAADLGAELAAALRPYGFAGPAFACPLRAGVAVLHAAGGTVPLAPGTRVLLASAIARPESFAAAVRELDFAVMGELRFRDHHAYPPASLDRIAAEARASGAAAVLVTSKDRVKLLGRLAVPLAELPVTAEPEPACWSWLDAAVDRLTATAARPAADLPTPQPGGGGAR
jgi:tetraacyldisaccharide 4'-kinase